MFNFEKLEVWNKALTFAEIVYKVSASFPDTERFGLTSQIRRAAVSISSNIAEGNSRSTVSDYRRFLEIAHGSASEVVSQATLAVRLGYITGEQKAQIYAAAEEQSRMLSGLRKSLIK